MEAELLRRLQHTQQKEQQVFELLENAMIDSSKPRKDRFNVKSTKLRGSKKLRKQSQY